LIFLRRAVNRMKSGFVIVGMLQVYHNEPFQR
jgi:hypothetical protein